VALTPPLLNTVVPLTTKVGTKTRSAIVVSLAPEPLSSRPLAMNGLHCTRPSM
jgi:hypothetical protein